MRRRLKWAGGGLSVAAGHFPAEPAHVCHKRATEDGSMHSHSVPARPARTLCGIAVAAALLASAATGADRYWSAPAGGWFWDSANWEGYPPPGPGDDAIFDLDTAGYTVEFAASRVSERLYVYNDGVTLDLNGESWALQGAFESVVVGYWPDDVALLTVTDGTLSGTEMLIAEDYWAIGTVSVQSGGVVDMFGAVEVGSLGDGLLEIVGGGLVACGSAHVAAEWDSVGYLTVSDGTSRLDCTGELRVGNQGEAYVELSNGGQADVGGDVIVAHEWESDAYLTVADAGSRLDVGGAVTVGRDGFGSMSILDGGLLRSGAGSVGSSDDAEGAVDRPARRGRSARPPGAFPGLLPAGAALR
ncbi:MAG: hypothetical protein WBF17_01980, partial [Phycisphaerae bacterium]